MTNFASVIIILYNGKKYISDCLDAIYTYKTNPIEVIVIDNASQDGSNELVKGHFPEVVIVQNQMNVGFAEACNQGAAWQMVSFWSSKPGYPRSTRLVGSTAGPFES